MYSVSQTMIQTRAAAIDRFGSADVLHRSTVALPPVGRAQVRLRVLATAVNPVDLATRASYVIQGAVYPTLAARFPMVLGWDAAGVIEEIGEYTNNRIAADHVVMMIPQPATQFGSYAEQIVVAAEQLAPWPGTHEPAVAAAPPLAGLTALQAITALRLSPGEKVFINGPLGAEGVLSTRIGATFALDQAAEAHRLAESHSISGKIVLIP